MHLKKRVMTLQITVFKNCNKRTPVYKKHWKWKVYVLNKYSYSNWKTIYPRLKFIHLLKKYWSTCKSSFDLFYFLSWFSTYVFITNCGLNGYVYISEIALDILSELIHDSQNIYGCLTLNEMRMKMTSLKIFQLTATSAAHHQHVHLKEKNSIV